MYLRYEDFIQILRENMKTGIELHDSIVQKVIDEPHRYCGLFRLSNAKSKLVQNITQSNEIKFGDFFENLLTRYLGDIGYNMLNKNLGTDNKGKRLVADQLFEDENKLYFIEQKIRDDHDSTKKVGQYNNFVKKMRLIQRKYPNKDKIAIMWFIDDSMKKNKSYYEQELNQLDSSDKQETHLFYGKELFSYLDRPEIWREIITHLEMYRQEMGSEVIEIPDFGNSSEIYDALMRLDKSRWKKLNSDTPIYRKLREELFTSGSTESNLEKAKKNRGEF